MCIASKNDVKGDDVLWHCVVTTIQIQVFFLQASLFSTISIPENANTHLKNGKTCPENKITSPKTRNTGLLCHNLLPENQKYLLESQNPLLKNVKIQFDTHFRV
ncbi:MAG: hypothetical protein CL920_38790 [Deltaproteobacteria bacterium]|nr:hypothetical protein [Deltaproteobacteria bacterium]|tara:strand:- start:5166 stop:5477 length:312 start_codon:yes stop_codon:yes gene_type:complete